MKPSLRVAHHSFKDHLRPVNTGLCLLCEDSSVFEVNIPVLSAVSSDCYHVKLRCTGITNGLKLFIERNVTLEVFYCEENAKVRALL